jgi:hypothetical protein
MKPPNRFQRILPYALSALVVIAAVYYATAFYYKKKIGRLESVYSSAMQRAGYSNSGAKEKARQSRHSDTAAAFWDPDDLSLSFRRESYLKQLAEGINFQFADPGRISLKDMMRLFGHLTVQHNHRDGSRFYFERPRQEGDAFGMLTEVKSGMRPGRNMLYEDSWVKQIDVDKQVIDIPRPFLFYQYSIVNNGDRPATVPILYNDVLWNSTPHIVATSGLAEIENETERALALWRFMIENRYHYYPVTNATEEVDIVKYLSIYGYGWCGESALVLAKLADEIGLEGRVWKLKGHVVPEVFADGKWILLDPDRIVYFHKQGDLQAVYGVEELARNKEAFTHRFSVAAPVVQKRLEPYLEAYTQYVMSTDDNVLNEFENVDADGRTSYSKIYATGATADYTIDNTLRPGEKVVFANHNWGKYFFGMFPFHVPKYFNGYYEYVVPLPAEADFPGECEVSRTPSGTLITNRSLTAAACLTVDNRHPFPIVGGEIKGSIQKQDGQVNVVLNDDDNDLTASYEVSQFLGGDNSLRIKTDSFFSILSDHPTYHYSVALEFQPGASVVIDEPMTVISDFQFAEMTLLKLQQGKNQFKVWSEGGGLADFEFKLQVM